MRDGRRDTKLNDNVAGNSLFFFARFHNPLPGFMLDPVEEMEGVPGISSLRPGFRKEPDHVGN